MNRTFLSFRAAFRTLANPWVTLHPALCRERVRLMSVLLDQRSSLLTLRRRSPAFVREIHWYYTAVRLLGDVHAGSTALAFPAVLWSASTTDISEVSRFSCMKFIGVLWGLRLRRIDRGLAISFPSMWLSAEVYGVSILIASFRSSIPSPPIPCLRFA